MQRVLTFKQGKKTYVSKAWDFEAFCLVHEKFLAETKGIPAMCSGAVDYLFRGTEATQDILDANIPAKFNMCKDAFAWFNEDLQAIAGKNSTAPGTEKEKDE